MSIKTANTLRHRLLQGACCLLALLSIGAAMAQNARPGSPAGRSARQNSFLKNPTQAGAAVTPSNPSNSPAAQASSTLDAAASNPSQSNRSNGRPSSSGTGSLVDLLGH